jgi:hypothetical protein
VRIRFTLPRQERILLTLLGPEPSCRPAGTVSIRGARGLNRLDFGGRVGRRSIRPGVYILSLTRGSSRRAVGHPLLVRVVSARRTILLGDAQARRAACNRSVGLVANRRFAALTPGLGFLSSREALPTGESPAGTAKPPARHPTPPRPERGHVLGTHVDLPALPGLDDGQQPWAFAGLVLLVGLPLLLMSVLVVRFLRGSWNP